MEHLRSNAHVYDQHFRTGICRIRWWSMAESQRSADRCANLWRILRRGSFSWQLHSLAVLVMFELRVACRVRSRTWLDCVGVCFGNNVLCVVWSNWLFCCL